MNYQEFLESKSQIGGMTGFDPVWMPDFLFDFQRDLVNWSLRKGRAALFADTGLGKTPMQLVWAENVKRKTNKPVLVITPLAVSYQTMREAEKFGIETERSRDGKFKSKSVIVTNYERLHYFDPEDFSGVVCDESSAIKNFEGERQAIVTEFMRTRPYRLLCTATASPNDFIELGTSAEALGELGRMDMLSMFFKNDENSLHPIWWGARWRFKAHAEKHFWRWVVSWARAIRKPSDMGYSDGKFKLPPLHEKEHIVKAQRPLDGMLFNLPAVTLDEQRAERRNTIDERCEMVAHLLDHDRPAVAWGHLNQETDLITKLIPDAEQIKGGDSDESKEEKFLAFQDGQIRILVTKPRIGAFGLNWQHCNHMTFFPSHSFEQYYQGVRRCWRFGQKLPVTVDVVTSEGEYGVMKNLQRKAEQADRLFTNLVAEMRNEIKIERRTTFEKKTEVPAWLS
jgi:hypothetical protein